jgi:subtilisin family serine protease
VSALALIVGATRAGSASGATHARPASSRHDRPYSAQSDALVHTDRSLLSTNSAKRVTVIVKLNEDPVALYAGGLPGLPATSPSVTHARIGPGRGRTRASAEAVRSYLGRLDRVDGAVTAQFREAVPTARVLYRYRYAFGGLAVRLPANRVAALLAVPGVVAVQRSRVEHVLTDVTPGFLHASDLWPSLGGAAHAGAGVLVGVIDTGIWPEHPSFADAGLADPRPGHIYPCQFGNGTDPDLGPAFACTHKLVGAYAFTQDYLAEFGALSGEFCDVPAHTCSARDADGHGSHTASTAAGDNGVAASIFGVDRGQISGMAPGASIIAYRACLSKGCTEADLVAAIDQAIADGVDVVNYSISGGGSYDDDVEQAFLSAYAANVVISAAAGNSGPAAGTANHVSPWDITVGASTGPRQFATTVDLAASGGASLDVTGVSVTPGVSSPTPVVFAGDVAGYADPLCATDLPTGSVNGKVVVCMRGGDTARVDKGFHAMQGGAAGMLLLNPVAEDVETDDHWLPAVHIDFAAGKQVLDFLDAHPGDLTATFPPGQPAPQQSDVLAAFSSRGPAGDFVKPDVVAPGIQVLAAKSPEPLETFGGPPGELFQAIAGTSMAAPHVAGVAALLRTAHPSWTAGQIKSALMTSAVTDPVLEDGTTPAGPFDMGAGRIRADTAASPTLTFDVPAQTYVNGIGDSTHLVDLNLPSVDAPAVPGSITTTRTATNVTGSEQTFHASATGPAGAISVTPADFTIPVGGTQLLQITIDGSNLPAGSYAGTILLAGADASATDVHLPVAFALHQGMVTLAASCTSTDLAVSASTPCSVTVSNTAGGTTTYDLGLHADVAAGQLAVGGFGAPAVADGNGFTATDTLQPSTAPLITGLRAGGPGFVDLRPRGVAPLGGVGDESMINVATGRSHFVFGGTEYHTLGIASDGYAVIGGADHGDLSFTPQAVPNPARPNNVLAPYWTDLNPAVGGKIYVGRVMSKGARYLVVEWRRVRVYHSSDVETFELWLRLGATQRVSFAYGPVTGAAAPTGLMVGAENADGTSAVTLPAAPVSGARYVVQTSGSRPGETETIPFTVTTGAAGDPTLTAVMHSPLVAGQTIVKVPLHVHG